MQVPQTVRRVTVGLAAATLLAGGLGVAVAANSSPTRTTTGISGPTRAGAGDSVTITGSVKDVRGRAIGSAVLRLVGREAGSSRDQNLFYGRTASNGTVAFTFTPPAGRNTYKVVYNGSKNPKRDASQSRVLTMTVTRSTASPSPSPSASGSPSATATPTDSGTPEPTTSGEPTTDPSATSSPTGGGRTCIIPLLPEELPAPICTDNPAPSAEPSPSTPEGGTPAPTETPGETPNPDPSQSARR